MRTDPAQRTSVLLLLSLAVLIGCGDGNPLGRRAVSGRVTLDGVPLAQGNIEFTPVAADGVSSGTNIADGKYAIARSQGVPPGEYLVRINAGRVDDGPLTPEQAVMPELHRPGVSLIPAKYNINTKLTATIADDVEELNFELTTNL